MAFSTAISKPDLPGSPRALCLAFRLLWLALAGWLAASPASGSTPGLALIQGGQGRAVIVVGEGGSGQARAAAAELRAVLERMTGVQLPIATNPAPAGAGVRILVGQAAARAEAHRMQLYIPSGLTPRFDEEAMVIATGRDFLILAGNETEPYQGTHYAVSEFLHELGCRWFMPGDFGEVLPKTNTIRVASQCRTLRPSLRVRDTWYSGHLPVSATQAQEFAQWKRRNRFCQPGFWSPEGSFLQNPTDDSTHRLLPAERYWASHPEYYAQKPDGARNPRFICMSNPGAIQAAADTVVDYFRKNPGRFSFAFSPPDEPVLCHCAACQSQMHGGYGGEGWGDLSDPYFRFVFDLAGRVGRVEPGRWIISMAYYNRCRPPEGVAGKQANVLIQLASIQQCDVHSYADEFCPTRRQFRSLLEGWAGRTAGQVFYEYDPHDWAHLQRPAWRSHGIAGDLRLLKSLGGWGFSNEGQMAWLSTGLNYYVRARLAWDLDQDPEAIVADFARRFFGPAAAPMAGYYRALEAALRTSPAHYPLGYSPEGPADDVFQFLSRPLFERCAGLLRAAEALATGDPFQRRVAAFRGHFERLDAARRARLAMAEGRYAEAASRLQGMLDAVTRVNDTALLQDMGSYGGALSGTNQLQAARRILEFTGGSQGTLLAVLPAGGRFRMDPASEGVVHRWYEPGRELGEWRPIRLDAGWHHQGVSAPDGRRYQGIGWYRADLHLATAPAGPVRLYFPEVKGSAAWVWCNGQFAGYWERSKQGPRDLDISGLPQSGHNEFVFRIKGEGGLTLPPFLFTPVSAAAKTNSVN